eukprot:TRINITY_DN76773_c0_g1_i1.p2 TRINITY_DN76773_c0_g1~~TRINITY_DN76773_c0_g1_i1.p2  ORF type:complete len:243 (+),score=46.61 TRINITY_DN76773_c0_g1_i1:64-729(+)
MASASCPNACSGHGRCSEFDRCSCFTRKDGTVDSEGNTVAAWQGPDCSLRTCPYAKAWVDVPFANNVAHLSAECSNAGTCDRKTGLCQCFPGYEGRACDRTVCPNKCSGHGTCQSQKQFFVDHADEASDASIVYSTAWDAKKIYGCKCELGFRGPDCSLKECPSGDDPQGGPDGSGFDLNSDGITEFRDCSGRGICDYSSGLCQCFKGYFGEDCSLQSTLI